MERLRDLVITARFNTLTNSFVQLSFISFFSLALIEPKATHLQPFRYFWDRVSQSYLGRCQTWQSSCLSLVSTWDCKHAPLYLVKILSKSTFWAHFKKTYIIVFQWLGSNLGPGACQINTLPLNYTSTPCSTNFIRYLPFARFYFMCWE